MKSAPKFYTLTVSYRYYDPPLQYCSRNSTPIQFRISSNMCIRGGCGKFGRCYQFFSGGNMFSTCTCFAGKAKNFQGLLCLLRRCYLASCNLILMPGIVKLFFRYTYIHFFRLLSKISFCLIFQGTKAGVVPTSRKPCPRLIY